MSAIFGNLTLFVAIEIMHIDMRPYGKSFHSLDEDLTRFSSLLMIILLLSKFSHNNKYSFFGNGIQFTLLTSHS